MGQIIYAESITKRLSQKKFAKMKKKRNKHKSWHIKKVNYKKLKTKNCLKRTSSANQIFIQDF